MLGSKRRVLKRSLDRLSLARLGQRPHLKNFPLLLHNIDDDDVVGPVEELLPLFFVLLDAVEIK